MNKQKICALVVFAVVAILNLNAQEGEALKNRQTSFGAAFIIALSDDMVSVGPSVQFSQVYSSLFTDFIGLGIHGGLIMPISEDIGFGVTLIAGPSITIYDNSQFKIPITLGMHANYVISGNHWIWNIGTGLVTDFVWQFSSRWFGYGRVQMACNFGAFEVLITPGLGLGLKR